MRRFRAGIAGVLVAVFAGVSPIASAAPLPSVSVVTLANGFYGTTQPCSDALGVTPVRFRFGRAGDVSAPLTLQVAWGGDAVAGTDYVPMAATVDFAAGASTADVSVVPLGFAPLQTRTLTLTVAVQPSASEYSVADPGSASATLTLGFGGPCPTPRFTDTATNSFQTISVGNVPAALVAELEGAAYSFGGFATVSGSLPPGVLLEADGTFAGRAHEIGSFASVVEVCAQFYAGRECSQNVLTVEVFAASLPRFTG